MAQKYNYAFEAPTVIRFVVTETTPERALARAREVLEDRATDDLLFNFDIEFADWYLDLPIKGDAPLTLVEVNEEEDE